MRLNFKKVSAIAASALMVGMTMGTAVAAYPTPFISGGESSVAIVYGTQAGFADGSPLDLIQANTINTDLSGRAGTGGSTTVTGGQYWEVGTSSNVLELGESIRDINKFIGNDELGLLADHSISNEKGDAKYEQFLYFEDTTSSMVNYYEDDDDNIGLFFKVLSGEVIARYVMDFTTNLKSDIETDMELSDIEDKSITFLGKTYTIVDASNGSSGVELTLMSGALGGTVKNGETLTVGNYQVDAVVSSTTAVAFTITSPSGTETTDKMAKGDMQKLADGNFISVTDITYEGYADGLHQATFYIGADKIEWKNGSDMTVNSETIGDAAVIITASEASKDISISEISVNMTAEDDLFVPVNGKLSKAANLDEPAVLVSQNWDIEFKGLEAQNYENIDLGVSESDQQYKLTYTNYAGKEIVVPLTFSNASGIFGGDTIDKRLVLNPANYSVLGGSGVTKNDFFFLHSADPTTASNEAKTLFVQYKGSDATTDTDPKVTFEVDGVDETMTLTTTGTFTLKAAGATFNFKNITAGTSDDFDIALVGSDYSDGIVSNNNSKSISNYIRTKYNTLINITDTNVSTIDGEDLGGNSLSASAPWYINVTVDDTNRDGNDFTLPDQGAVFQVILGNTSTDTSATYGGTSTWLTDPDNSDVQKFITRYGVEVTKTDPSDSPASITAKVPENIVKPLLYVSTGDLVVTSTGGATGALGYILVKDSEVSSVSSKNLVVVGGSCVNSVAAKLVGEAACGADFTAKTGVGSGQFLIQSYANPYTTGKIALLVAGYDAVDTKNAATYLTTKEVDTTVGKKYKGTSATSAELVVA